MGGGTWSSSTYGSLRASRLASATPDFAHNEKAKFTHEVHESLKPQRIIHKAAKVLESCDSSEHPLSLPVIITFDVTGSNYNNAVVAQQKLPLLMDRLMKDVPNPQVAVWSNDDYNSVGKACIQISDFESDIRIDEAIRNTWLTSRGGGNMGESYDLLLFAAARLTRLDSLDKRGKKGYMFLYADEPVFQQVHANEVNDVFGIHLQADIPIAEIVKEVQAKYHLYFLWPVDGYTNARKQYEALVGKENVINVQDPDMLIETIASELVKAEATDVQNAEAAHEAGEDFYRPIV